MKLLNYFSLLFSLYSNKIYIYHNLLSKSCLCKPNCNELEKKRKLLTPFWPPHPLIHWRHQGAPLLWEAQKAGPDQVWANLWDGAMLAFNQVQFLTPWENAWIFLKFRRTFGKIYSTSKQQKYPQMYVTTGNFYAIVYKQKNGGRKKFLHFWS